MAFADFLGRTGSPKRLSKSAAGEGSCDIASNSMGAGFCNLRSLGWHTRKALAPIPLREQRELQSDKVGREEVGLELSSNRPELVALRKCLEAQEDHINLLYLTDSEPSLQVIHKWVRGGKHDLCTESSRCGYQSLKQS
jgi:hypothetical protein